MNKKRTTKRKKRDTLKELAKLRFKASKSSLELCQEVEDDFW